jgi:hypothetical protein
MISEPGVFKGVASATPGMGFVAQADLSKSLRIGTDKAQTPD